MRRVAARQELQVDDLWEHITHCSPCYASFLAYKDKQRKEQALRRRTLLSLALATAAATPIVLYTHFHASQPGEPVLGDWDLERSSSSRGTDAADQSSISRQQARRARGQIRVRLPLGSDEGEYQLQIRKTEEGSALQTSTGTAHIVNGHTILSLRVDLSPLPAGDYFAAIGRGSRTWRVYPLTLR